VRRAARALRGPGQATAGGRAAGERPTRRRHRQAGVAARRTHDRSCSAPLNFLPPPPSRTSCWPSSSPFDPQNDFVVYYSSFPGCRHGLLPPKLSPHGASSVSSSQEGPRATIKTRSGCFLQSLDSYKQCSSRTCV
jgi:hypothetical protein